MTREEALEILCGIESVGGSLPKDGNLVEEALNMAYNALEQLSEPRWIPVGERLPTLGERVLCQCQANIYEVLKLTVDGWYHNPNHCYMESFVIAWMPLPEPYKESDKSVSGEI